MPFIPDSGESAAAPPPGTVYSVDISGLFDFAGFVRQEFDGEFAPSKQRVEVDSRPAAQWGAGLPGDLVTSVRTNCLESHRQMYYNLERYLHTSGAIVDVINQLAEAYRTADDMALIDPEKVLADLSRSYAPPATYAKVGTSASTQDA